MRILKSQMLFAIFVLALPVQASALTIAEALQMTLDGNPSLQAKKAERAAAEANMKVYRGGLFPELDATGSYAVNHIKYDNSKKVNAHPRSASLVLSQKIFNGGKTVSALRSARSTLKAAEADLKSTEQNTLLAAAEVYLNVLRDKQVLDLNRFQVDVLRKQLEATKSRFELGDVTKTDVSQAEARLAAAKAAAVAAEAQLIASRASFEEVVGTSPDNLKWPTLETNIPTELDSIMSQVMAQHPLIAKAVATLAAQKYKVTEARGGYLPTVTAEASLTRSEGSYSVFGAGNSDQSQLMLNVSLPLFRGGSTVNQVNSELASKVQAERNYYTVRRQVRRELVDAFHNYRTAQAELSSRREAIQASKLALEGVKKEAEVGTRTVLDVLDAEQEHMQAQVDEVSARHAAVLDVFRLLAAMGVFTEADFPTYFPTVAANDKAGDKAKIEK